VAETSSTTSPTFETDDRSNDARAAFDVILIGCSGMKVPVINIVREVTGWGLKEAKTLVDTAPQPIVQGVAKDTAEKLQAELVEAGATVELEAYRVR
jgi:large subunit ribosomal protein L7/L12